MTLFDPVQLVRRLPRRPSAVLVRDESATAADVIDLARALAKAGYELQVVGWSIVIKQPRNRRYRRHDKKESK